MAVETTDVKYRGPVELAKFGCTGELVGSLVKRVCYNAEHDCMPVRLKQTWYHYCGIDQGTVTALLAAQSVGSFYNFKHRGLGDRRRVWLPR